VTAEVVDLRERRVRSGPHSEGTARCIACRHEWTAVAPAGAYMLECPACSLNTGAYINAAHAAKGAEVLACSNCGCDLFFVMKPGVLRCHRCAGQVGEVTVT
jgi:hypothetical protein